ncbi:hypothetical protein PHMEG_00022828 [Phytophthora megakarya]|uniref:Uncharacterized protein n=1 Tax=Phytophthora megakarya TaxID=4795 RepID=A0A225VJS8_9STRA|nr:hypothetical protein PHMEG_00022828 [Phytophthora megakarya]
MGEGMESFTVTDFNKPFQCIAYQHAKQKNECHTNCNMGNEKPTSRFKGCYLMMMKSDATPNIEKLVLRLEKTHDI